MNVAQRSETLSATSQRIKEQTIEHLGFIDRGRGGVGREVFAFVT